MPPRCSRRVGHPPHPPRRSKCFSVCVLAFLLTLTLAVPEAYADDTETLNTSECFLRVTRALETVPPAEVTAEMRDTLLTACEGVAAALAAAPDDISSVDALAAEALQRWNEVIQDIPSDGPSSSPTPKPTPEPRPRAPQYPVTGTTGDDRSVDTLSRNTLSSDADAETGSKVSIVNGGPGSDGPDKTEKPPSAASVVSLCIIAVASVVALTALCVPSPFRRAKFSSRNTGQQTDFED